MTDLRIRALALAIVLALAAPAAASAQAPPAAGATLYARLGGYDAIAGFVDTAFPRVASHPELTQLFRGHSRDSQVRQRQLIVDALCQATGGPCFYTGRAMKPVHVGLGITEAQWDTFMRIISATADERRLPEPVKREFLTIFTQRFRPDVVE
jgi:hemoglobin